MNNKWFFTAVLFSAVILSCQKQPVADFTSANYSAHAGETIHLVNTSVDADKYKWTAPDGKTYDSKDLDYPTLAADTHKTISFTLEATQGNHKSSVTKSIVLKQAIFASDYFSVNGNSFKPTDKTSAAYGNNTWRVTAIKSTNINLALYFYGSSPPWPGAYTLRPNNFSLSNYEASLTVYDGSSTHNSYSGGQVNITIPSPGLLRAEFTNVSDGSGSLLSGDITFH